MTGWSNETHSRYYGPDRDRISRGVLVTDRVMGYNLSPVVYETFPIYNNNFILNYISIMFVNDQKIRVTLFLTDTLRLVQ